MKRKFVPVNFVDAATGLLVGQIPLASVIELDDEVDAIPINYVDASTGLLVGQTLRSLKILAEAQMKRKPQ